MHSETNSMTSTWSQFQFIAGRYLVAVLCCASLVGCATTSRPSASEQAVVVGDISPAKTSDVKRQQLEIEIRRFADVFGAVMALEADRIMERAGTPELRWFATGWKLSSRGTAVDIAVGANAVENMMDMLVLTALTSQELEEFWVPKFLGPKLGQGLLQASKRLEADVWERARNVMTDQQLSDLRNVIKEWKADHPDQHYFWQIRMAGFSSQRANQLRGVSQTGGLLGEMVQARETADEIREFGERLLYYVQRAPTITRLEAEFGMRTAFRSPEFQQLLHNTERLTRSAEAYADFARNFPAEREATIKQVMELEHDVLQRLLASEELKRATDRISNEGGEIVNVAVIRVAVLLVFWAFLYVGARLAYDRFRAKTNRGSV